MTEVKVFNRKGRRAYEKKLKTAPYVYFCPRCQMRTCHNKVASVEYVWKKDMQCEICGNRSVKGTS